MKFTCTSLFFNFIQSAVIFSSIRAGVWGSKGGVVTDLFGVPKEACSQICLEFQRRHAHRFVTLTLN